MDYYFVDKSMLMKEVIDDASEVKLITRPRRFGKTLNLSMLKYYFEKGEEENTALFKHLHIWQQGYQYQQEQGKYPVVTINLKDVKYDNYEYCLEKIKVLMAREFLRHDYILDSEQVKDEEKRQFMDITGKRGNEVELSGSIEFLTGILYKYHGEKVIVLIDEYDTPINHGFLKGFYERIISFMRVFLGSGLKSNTSLRMGVLTGIYRVAKESIFSDMNNFDVSTITTGTFADYFGFTEKEVGELLDYYGLYHTIQEVQNWYNGYLFGKTVLYNPWSILNYVKHKELEPYWVNTSSNDLILDVLKKTSKTAKQKLSDLLEEREIHDVRIQTDINFRDIIGTRVLNEDVLWNFLLVSGYLKASSSYINNEGDRISRVSVPNKEILKVYRDTIAKWFDVDNATSSMIKEMLKHLMDGRLKQFERDFHHLVRATFSSFDVGWNAAENFYHAFTLGILVNLDKEYRVVSNRESGDGRPDILIIPEDKTKKGIVMEFKISDSSDDTSMKGALQEALNQIQKKRYMDELNHSGVKEVIKTGIVFYGNDVRVGYQIVTLSLVQNLMESTRDFSIVG